MIPRPSEMKKGLIIFLLLLSAIFLAPFSPVHAGSPTVTQKGTANCNNVTSCGSAIFSGTTANDVIIIAISANPQNANEGSLKVSSISINAISYTLQVQTNDCYSSCAMAGNFIDSEIWSGTVPSNGAVGSFSVNFNALVGNTYIEQIEVNQISATQSCTATGGSGTVSQTSGNTATSCTSSTDALVVGSPSIAACLTINGGASYTTYPSANQCGVMIYGSLAGSTNFPFTISAAGSMWVEGGAFFAAPATTFTVVACTFFQLQCWWYPILMFGCFAGIFTMVGAVGKASQRGITYLLLTGLTYCSLLEVMMGMITVMMPVVLTGLTLLYAARTR